MQMSGFDWDAGNLDKCRKRGVSIEEIESLFTRSPTIMVDTTHSENEERLRAIGKTEAGRYIFLVFTQGPQRSPIHQADQCPIHAREGDRPL